MTIGRVNARLNQDALALATCPSRPRRFFWWAAALSATCASIVHAPAHDEYAHEDTSSNHTRVDGMKTYRNEIVPFDAIRLTKRSLPELVFTVRIFHHHPVAEPLRFFYLDRIRDRRSSCRSWGLVGIRSSARSPSSCCSRGLRGRPHPAPRPRGYHRDAGAGGGGCRWCVGGVSGWWCGAVGRWAVAMRG